MTEANRIITQPRHLTIRLLLVAVVAGLLALVGCTADNDVPPTDHGKKPVSVQLSINASAATTRSDLLGSEGGATNTTWNDKNATDGEFMRNCFAVAVQQGKIVGFVKSGDLPVEQSYVSTLAMKLQPEETTIYSFANISPSQLGIDESTAVGSDAPDFDNMTFGIDGNVTSAADFKEGIPMSGKRTVSITEKTQQVDLEVVRMVAKMTIRLSNDTPADIQVKGVSLSDITDNSDSNIMLMPLTDYGQEQAQPNLAPQATKAMRNVAIGGADGLTVKANRTNTIETTFYLNESVAKTPKYFVVNVETTQQNISHRVALLSWNTIARGDYLVLPIRLNDYRLTYDVEQFTAIGVLPSVENDKDMLTVRFHSYGEFHMRPTVTRLSDGEVLTPGSNVTGGWTLVDWTVLEMQPDGDEGTCIYDQMPYADHSRRMFEGYMGNRKGYALHQVLFHVAGLDYDIPYKVQIINE